MYGLLCVSLNLQVPCCLILAKVLPSMLSTGLFQEWFLIKDKYLREMYKNTKENRKRQEVLKKFKKFIYINFSLGIYCAV